MRLLILLAAVLVFAVTPAFSQMLPGKIEVTAQGGVNMPTGNLGDTSKLGYGFGGSVGFRPMDRLVLGAEVMYYGNGATDEALAALGAGADMNMSIIQFSAMAKVMFPLMTSHNVYAKGTLGGYNATNKFENVPLLGSGSVSDTNFGAGIGGGLRINGSGKASFFAEGMFHHIAAEGTSAQFLTASAGILFTLP